MASELKLEAVLCSGMGGGALLPGSRVPTELFLVLAVLCVNRQEDEHVSARLSFVLAFAVLSEVIVSFSE